MDDITELPFGLPGRVFRSPMPFGAFDPGKVVLKLYQENAINVVVQLVSDDEARDRTGKELRRLYLERGYDVIYLPTLDFSIPDRDALQAGVSAAETALNSGSNLAVHCNAGIGRTGLFLACLAKRCQSLSGKDAVHWVRQYIPGAMEVPEQVLMVMDF